MSDAKDVSIELDIKLAPERRGIEANMVSSSTSGTRFKAPMAVSQRTSQQPYLWQCVAM